MESKEVLVEPTHNRMDDVDAILETSKVTLVHVEARRPQQIHLCIWAIHFGSNKQRTLLKLNEFDSLVA